MTSTLPEARTPGRLDRVATNILPPFDHLGRPSTVLAPLVLVLLIALATTAATQTWGFQLLPTPPSEAPFDVRRLIWIVAMVTPIFTLAKAGVLTLAAWSVLMLLGSTAEPKRLLSALLYGEVILACQGLVFLLTLLVQGGPIPGPVPVVTGLDLFARTAHPAWLALARGVTPLQVVWMVFLGYAFASITKSSRTCGFIAAGALWLLVTGLGVLRAILIQGAA